MIQENFPEDNDIIFQTKIVLSPSIINDKFPKVQEIQHANSENKRRKKIQRPLKKGNKSG